MIFLGSGQVNWITKNCGESFRAFSRNREKLKQVKMHPTQDNWILGLTDNACPRGTTQTPCYSFQKLWLSEDQGITWIGLANYIYKFEWGFFNSTDSEVP